MRLPNAPSLARRNIHVAIAMATLLAACEPAPAGGTAGFGQPCPTGSECASGLCVAGTCTMACADDCACPAGNRCAATSGSFSVCAAGANACPRDGGVCAARETHCADSVDDDCDGQADCADADCVSSPSCGAACTPSPESSDAACRNGTDDDCDGSTDCADPDCRGSGVSACFGDWAPNDCISFRPVPSGLPASWEVHDLEVELTPTGFRTLMRIPNLAEAVQIELVVNSRATGAFDLEAPQNQYLRTCTHCITITSGGRTYYPRAGGIVLDAVPTRVGETLRGSIGTFSTMTSTGALVFSSAAFDEVTVTGGEVALVPGGQCLFAAGRFSGIAVEGGVVATGSGSRVGSEMGMRQRGGTTPSCGDGVCGAAESPSSCAVDCPCSPSAFTQTCPDGHLCPHEAQCISRGRCVCGVTPNALSTVSAFACSGVTPCTAGSCAAASWGCYYTE